MGRSVRWIRSQLPAERRAREARERVRAQAWQRKMYERTQGRPVRLGLITREGVEPLPPETADLLRSVEDELDQEGY